MPRKLRRGGPKCDSVFFSHITAGKQGETSSRVSGSLWYGREKNEEGGFSPVLVEESLQRAGGPSLVYLDFWAEKRHGWLKKRGMDLCAGRGRGFLLSSPSKGGKKITIGG